ncbi:MAG TPA: PBP1A family penicillin-binding protein [Caulobacteraceae bacterium]|nr:PBP1A family penicillin-binding protein [Caulobacteraceae bacterium]
MTFLDRNGAIIATRGAHHGQRVTLQNLPPYVARAFLAAEDRRFYKHGPVDLLGILRAARANLSAGSIIQGGSTLTQQIAKTLFLTPDQTFKRKVQEMVLAWRLEKMLSKDEVLELYLNRVFFGANAYGVDAAAQTYFGKPAAQLNLAEAALLAALPKAPSRLSPSRDLPGAIARSRLVLARMLQEGWISPSEQAEALASPPRLVAENKDEGDYGYVLDLAAAQAQPLVGQSAPDLILHLTVDPMLQTTAAQIVRRVMDTEGERAGAEQAAAVLLAPDGAIRALVGGVDHRYSPFDRASQARRQPGSSFKPFIYAAALEIGLKPTDTRVDAPVRLGPWSPQNYGGGYVGPVTLADALARSINTVAVRVAQEVGSHKIGDLAARFGLTDIPADPDLSVALGAYEVTLLELTSGFQVFQQGGARTPSYLIDEIDTAGGDLLYRRAPSAPIQVYDQALDGTMIKMMKGVIEHGTGVHAGFGRPAAGKTGTSQNWRDAWFIGFTPDWVGGVWVGNDDDRPMNKVTGGDLPAQIWRRLMVVAHQGVPPHDFTFAPGAEAPSDSPVASDEAVAAPAAADTQNNPRAAFYRGLAQDFDSVANAPAAVDGDAR